ncbi:MAG: HK97 gp10 family phage protein [Planctomycetota bacterium]
MAGTYAELDTRAQQRIMDEVEQLAKELRPDVVREVGEAVIGEAQELAPVRTGTLKNSDFVDDTDLADKGQIVIGFGADYALAVHETHPTRSRFLADAIKRFLPTTMRKAIRRALRRTS